MKPVQHEGTVIDNLPGEEVEAKLSATAGHLIMKSLSDLYSNRSLAVIREYSTNAHDSHLEAGIKDPIDVTLPNELHPFFSVTDHGVGLDKETLKELYMTFGDSTKRKSNKYNGLLGYGCKSALAYTNSFTVTAVKDGRKTIAVITRREDEVMILKVVHESDTTERNGVSVQVPVSNIDEFNRIALRFYKFWPQGSVLINGESITNPFTDKLGKGLFRNNVDGDSFVVMGNVPYPINNPKSLFPSNDVYVPFVVYAKMGDVEFTPSRESLKYTPRTTDYIQGVVDSYIKERRDLAEKEVAHAKTKWEALKFSRKWWNLLKVRIPYKGEKIPGELEAEGFMWHTHWRRYPVERMHKSLNNGSINLDGNFMVVTGLNNIGSYQKERLKAWARTKHAPADWGGRLPDMLYAPSDPSWNSDWIEPSRIIDWETVKAQTPPPARVGNAKGRIKGSWDLLLPDGSRVYGKPIRKAKYWMPLSEVKRWERRGDWWKIVQEFGFDKDVVIVPANRINTFKRNFPNAVYYMDHLKTMVDLDGDALYNKEQREYFALDHSERRALVKWDENKIEDPDFKRLVELAKRTDITKPVDYDKNLRRAQLLNLQFKMLAKDDSGYTQVEQRYPLLQYGLRGLEWGRSAQYSEHTYYYVNAAYDAARKANNV